MVLNMGRWVSTPAARALQHTRRFCQSRSTYVHNKGVQFLWGCDICVYVAICVSRFECVWAFFQKNAGEKNLWAGQHMLKWCTQQTIDMVLGMVYTMYLIIKGCIQCSVLFLLTGIYELFF